MKLEHSFEVAAPPARVWEALIDVERIVPCLPGATIVARHEDGGYDGEFRVKIGPTSATYSGRLHPGELDAGERRATAEAAGTDKRGQGGAKATIVATVADAGEGAATVGVELEYRITGRLARFARGGTIEEVSVELLAEFSENVRAMLEPDSDPEPEPEPAPEPRPGPGPEPPAPTAETPAGGALVERIGSNPVPLLALVLGFLLALRVLRRRS